MKKTIYTIFGFLFTAAICFGQGASADDIIMKAMGDELSRSMEKLKTKDLSKPYFISYGVVDAKYLNVEASFGSLVYSESNPRRMLYVDLRVGSYAKDNSNFADPMSMMNSIMSGTMSMTTIPMENNYDVIRREIWLASDEAFKKAHEDYSNKQATFATAPKDKEKTSDWSIEKPQKFVEPSFDWNLDREKWEKTIRAVSAVFKTYPHVKNAGIEFSAKYARQYLANSEGSRIVQNNITGTIVISATSQNEEGELISDNRVFIVKNISDLPDETTLLASANELAGFLESYFAADTINRYLGPVLFEGQAASELWLNLVGDKLVLVDLPIIGDERMKSMLDNLKPETFADRFGEKVLPASVSVWDDPTQPEFGGVKLAGCYKFDNEGIPAQKVNLIEKGNVTGVLMHRKPFKNFKNSNGHARLGTFGTSSQPYVGALYVVSSEGLASDKMRAKFVEECKAQGLSKGYIIRRIYHPTDEKAMAMRMISSFMPGNGGDKGAMPFDPIEVYEVNLATGNEKLVKGATIKDLGTRTLRDILAVGDIQKPYNTSPAKVEGSGAAISIIAPDVLFSEVELSKKEVEKENKPYITSPLHSEKQSHEKTKSKSKK